jgi:hypothetical protein
MLIERLDVEDDDLADGGVIGRLVTRRLTAEAGEAILLTAT